MDLQNLSCLPYPKHALGFTCLQCKSSENTDTNDKILDMTKLKTFADDKSNAAKMMTSLFERVEISVEKGENVCYQHFLLFP